MSARDPETDEGFLESLRADLRDLVVALHPDYPFLAGSTMSLVQLLGTQYRSSNPRARRCGITSLIGLRSALLIHAALIPSGVRSHAGFAALLDLHSWLEDQARDHVQRPITIQL